MTGSGTSTWEPGGAGLQPGRRPRVPRVAVAALLAVLGAVAAAGWLSAELLAPEVDERPLTLPGTFAGLPRAPAHEDFGAQRSWQEGAGERVDGAGLAGATYRATGKGIVNVTAVRTDATGKLDLNLAGDPGDAYGDVRCTRNIDFPDTDGLAPARPGVDLMLCWRTSVSLSVIAFVLGGPLPPEEVAGGVQAVWDGIRAGDAAAPAGG